ncbi:MAG: hypothetical protein GY863_08110 [bacterium]|nr:hypothetical protein [bacterium]
MKCEDIEKLLPDFLKGDLDPDVKQDVKKHLEDCPECRLEAKSLNMLWEKLEEMPEEMPSARMDDRFNTMMEAYESGVKKGRSQVSLYHRFNEFISMILPKTPALQFALIAVIFFAGLFLGDRTQGGDDSIRNSELARMREDIRNTNQLVMMSLMNQATTSERIKNIVKFASYERLSEEAINTLITVLNNDPDTNVRLESIEILDKFIDNPFVKDNLLIALQSQENPYVQIALIDMFVLKNEQKAAEIFKSMLFKNDLNFQVKQRLEEGIANIS